MNNTTDLIIDSGDVVAIVSLVVGVVLAPLVGWAAKKIIESHTILRKLREWVDSQETSSEEGE